MSDQEKIIRDKIMDNRRFGFLALFLSTFLFIGSLLPTFEMEPWKSHLLFFSSLAFIVLSFLFQYRVRKLMEKLRN
jgi:hypothetical protein